MKNEGTITIIIIVTNITQTVRQKVVNFSGTECKGKKVAGFLTHVKKTPKYVIHWIFKTVFLFLLICLNAKLV